MSGIAALVLAAGRSSRYAAATDGANKLLADFGGRPMARRIVETALASRARPVIVVTGHMADAVRAALDGQDVAYVHNPDFGEGLATSLNAGIAALPADVAGAVILLADMPAIPAGAIDGVIGRFAEGAAQPRKPLTPDPESPGRNSQTLHPEEQSRRDCVSKDDPEGCGNSDRRVGRHREGLALSGSSFETLLTSSEAPQDEGFGNSGPDTQDEGGGHIAAVVPTVGGVWAHPVLLGRALFRDVAGLSGDAGARKLLAGRADVATLELGDPRLLADADTPEALAAALALTSAAGPSR